MTKKREKVFLFGFLLLGSPGSVTGSSHHCNKNDLDIPKNGRRWHCFDAADIYHSDVPIGSKCELKCKTNYRLVQGMSYLFSQNLL